MAYFQRRQNGEEEHYTRRFEASDWNEDGPEEDSRETYPEEYDDELNDQIWDDTYSEEADPEEDESGEWTEEDLAEERKRKFRIAAGVGDLVAILAGTAVILVLAAFLISMVQFVSADFSQNFSIWATKF